jgi:hypothetical protein
LLPLCHKEIGQTLHEWWILNFLKLSFPLSSALQQNSKFIYSRTPHQQDLLNNHHQQYTHGKLWSAFWQMVVFLPTLNALSTDSCSSGYSPSRSTGVLKVFANNSL